MVGRNVTWMKRGLGEPWFGRTVVWVKRGMAKRGLAKRGWVKCSDSDGVAVGGGTPGKFY